jgi:hypothetical protein
MLWRVSLDRSVLVLSLSASSSRLQQTFDHRQAMARGKPIAGHFQHRFRTLVSTRSTEVGRAYAQCELSGGWTIPAIRRRTNYEQKLPEPSCRPPQQTGSPGSYSRPEAPSGRLNLNSCFCFNYSKTNSTYAQPYAQTRLPQNGRLAA